MEIKQDLDFNDLMRQCWQGAVDTLKTIEENNMEDEFMQFLEEYYMENVPTLTEVNDLLWFDDSFIFEQLGINEEDDEEGEE